VGRTIAEKILSARLGRPVRAGEYVVAPVDLAYSHDANRPLPMSLLGDLGAERVWDPARYVLCLDHYPSPTDAVAKAHHTLRAFAEAQGVRVFDVGAGISHIVLAEHGMVGPGDVVIASDSHTCTLGALGAFATGVGSSDLAAVLATGAIWLRVPDTLRITCSGRFGAGVTAKDLTLEIARRIGADGATYKAIEYAGEPIRSLPMDQRFTLSNMAIEFGAKCGFTGVDAITLDWLAAHGRSGGEELLGDADADVEHVAIDLDALEPTVAAPHSPVHSRPAGTFADVAVDQVVIGTCNNGRLDDLAVAARILRGRRVAPGVRLYVTPGSRKTMAEAMESGALGAILGAGATIGTPGCSGCVGGCHWAIPADGDVVLTTANRNFRGRLGNKNAAMYLASPATAAASALTGRITDPRPYLGGEA